MMDYGDGGVGRRGGGIEIKKLHTVKREKEKAATS
jgi:hypothetical protein